MPQLRVQPKAKPNLPAVESDAFRSAMRQLPGGVCVITAGEGGDRTGMTATSLSSFSLDPPTLIVSINREASIRPVLNRYGAFGASILRAGQKSIADRFAGVGGLKGNGRFNGERWITLETGAPLLAAALAVFDCEVDEIIDRYTHSIVIGRVKAVQVSVEGGALVHWQGQYSASSLSIPKVDHDWEGT